MNFIVIKKISALLIGITLVFSVQGYAAANPDFHPIELNLMGGVATFRLDNNVNVDMGDDDINSYNTTQQTFWNGIGGAGLAYVFRTHHHIHIAIGPSAYFTDLGHVQGIESPYSNIGNFETLNYQFFARSYSLLLESRIIFTESSWQPFIIGGIGNAWNRLYGYSEVPTDPNGGALPAPSVFGNNTMSTFAFDVGIGIQHQLFADRKHQIACDAALSYRYFNLGAGKLAQSAVQSGNQYLRIDKIDTNAILGSLTIAFG